MTTNNINIIVIGGGISGIHAALWLSQQNQNKEIKYNITILEATEKVGGRIRQVKVSNSFIDVVICCCFFFKFGSRVKHSFLEQLHKHGVVVNALHLFGSKKSNTTFLNN